MLMKELTTPSVNVDASENGVRLPITSVILSAQAEVEIDK